jgi:hypothetical protein
MTEPPGPAAERDDDSCGRARAITLYSPIRPFGTLWTRLMFAGASLFPHTTGVDKLSSVYFLRWTILTEIPYNGPPQVPEGPAHPVLLWESTYTGLAEPYIEAFTYVIAPQINRTWKGTYGWPGARTISELKQYIGQLRVPGAYYFSAYPTATVRMVRSALEVAREHRFLRDAARNRHTTPEEFAVVYRGFLTRRQEDL